jgi:hypothetical protein
VIPVEALKPGHSPPCQLHLRVHSALRAVPHGVGCEAKPVKSTSTLQNGKALKQSIEVLG